MKYSPPTHICPRTKCLVRPAEQPPPLAGMDPRQRAATLPLVMRDCRVVPWSSVTLAAFMPLAAVLFKNLCPSSFSL